MPRDEVESLENLIARCAAGDNRALELLYQQTSSKLFGLVRRILSREDLAQEALQDVYVSVWRNAGQYNCRKGAAFTWLVSIARYRAIDIKRSRRNEIPLGNQEEFLSAGDGYEASGGELTTSADHAAEVIRLNTCLGLLDLNQRSAVGMAYLRGLTHGEVAARIRAPLGTVKTWIRRGLASLKECLES